MALLIRLVRALWIFGLIFCSYMAQLGLLKVFRRWQLDAEAGREVATMPAWLARRGERVDARNARRLLRGMLRLRGVYIKLGQVLSIMGGFLPRVYGKELESLQDAVPPRPFREIEKAFIESLGRPPAECYARIEERPVAAASLGQVHVAYLDDGRKVAVKVLYPGIRDVIRTDMKVVRLALIVYRRFVPVQNLDAIHHALVDLLRRETDYLHEAACMERMAENFREEPDILFPEVVHELTTREVLTMTFMEGFKITDLAKMDAAGIDRRVVATLLVKSFYKQLFVDRLFHADPHPGNFLVQPSDDPHRPRLVVLDFGATSEVSIDMVDGMVDVLRSFFEQDESLVLRGVERIGFVAPDGDRELLERTMKKYFEKLLKIEDRTAGALMRANQRELEALADPEVERRELRRLMESVRYPDNWFFVERAAVLMFWLCAQIDPDLDTITVGFPYVLPLLAERIAAQ
jgi:predicted unusual protein kinase regulating ubiquinone biosynthesis (AarF/ABC1/UbiB family)